MQVDKDKIEKAARFWDETERVVKEAEQISQEMVVPAISELRYAGRKLVDYLAALAHSDEGRDPEEHIADFLQCCIRARHDSLDAAVSYIIQYLELLEQQISPLLITKRMPEYTEFKKSLFEVSGLIVASREHRAHRIEAYSEILQRVESEIFPKFTQLRIMKPELFEQQGSLEKRESLSSWMTALAAVFAVVTALSTILMWAR